ncbi:MAG: TRAP transporter substrate-binding protein DctP [Thermodesulfobacteriota bacterium]
MGKRRRSWAWMAAGVVLAVGLLTGIQPSHSAEKVIKWKCQSHWPTASSSYKDSLLRLVENVKSRTNGRLVIEPFAAESLVPSPEIFSAVKRGMIEMGTASPGYFRDQVPLAGIASGLPFAFRQVWECAYFHKVLGFEQMMRDACAPHGVYLSTDKVYPTEMVSKKPIEKMEDFKGLKVRSSGVLANFLTALGGAGSYIPGPEIYPALASGVIDAAHWGAVQGAASMGFYDVCKYHVKPGLNIASTDVWLINQKAMDALPADIKEVLLWSLEEQFWFRTNQYEYLEAVTLAKVQKEKGVKVIVLPPEEQKKITEVAVKIWDAEAKKAPENAKAVELLKNFLKDLGYF